MIEVRRSYATIQHMIQGLLLRMYPGSFVLHISDKNECGSICNTGEWKIVSIGSKQVTTRKNFFWKKTVDVHTTYAHYKPSIPVDHLDVMTDMQAQIIKDELDAVPEIKHNLVIFSCYKLPETRYEEDKWI